MQQYRDELSNIEDKLFSNSFIKKFLDVDSSEEKLIYKSYINRLLNYLVYNDTELNNLDEVLELFLSKNIKIITLLDILQIIKKEFMSVIKDKESDVEALYEVLEMKQNYLVHQYVENYFAKYSNMQLILEELELKEHQFDKQSKIFEEYKRAVDISSIVSKTDEKGIITYVNDSFCEISGYSAEELVGNSHSLVRHPSEPKELYQELWKSIQSGNVWHGILRNIRKDGSTYIVDATIMPIKDSDENIVEYIAIRKDITDLEHKKLELERLKASELRDNINKAISISNSQMVDNIPLPAIIIDKDDNIESFNELFAELFDIIDNSDIYEKLESNEAKIYDICKELEESIWKYELDTVDNKLEVELKNIDNQKVTLSLKEIEDKFLVVMY
jgi:PAS domain S-box-containing protein